MEPLDWRDQRIDTILRHTGKTVDELCRLPPNELVRLCAERIIAYRLVERSSTPDKPAMMVDAALSEIADFVLPLESPAHKDGFVRAMTEHIRDWVNWDRGFRLRERIGQRPRELEVGDGYGTRIWNAMKDNEWTLLEMASKSDDELLRLPNIGRKTVERLRELAAGKPYRRQNDDGGVNPKGGKSPWVRAIDDYDREVDRAGDRDEQDEPRRDNRE